MPLIRPFWLAVVCTLGLLASATGVHAQAMKLLPADTEMMVTIDVRQILNSEIVKSNDTILKLLKQQMDEQLEDKGYAKYFKQAKFDLLKDLHNITFAVSNGKQAKDGLIVLEGNFDAKKIETAIADVAKEKDIPFKVTQISGVSAFEIAPKDEKKAMYVGVLDNKTMIACATQAEFASAVAQSKASKAAFKSATFRNLLSSLDAKPSISVVVTSAIIEKLAEAQDAPEQVKQAAEVAKQVEGGCAAITIDKNINFQGGIQAKDANSADAFANLAKFAITNYKDKIAEQAKQNENLVPVGQILNSLNTTTKGANLTIRGQITPEVLGKLMRNLPIPQQN